MRKYTDPQNTPLIFHTFVRFVFFPLGMLGQLAAIFLLLPYIATNFLALVTVPLCIAYFIASLACVVGFGKWKSYSWYALLWALGLRIVSQLLSSGLDFYDGVSSLDIASEIIGCLIANGLIFLYYYKRRALFFQPPAPQPVETAEPVQAPALVAVTSNSETAQPDIPVPVPDVSSSTPQPAPKRSKPQPLAVASVILAVAVVVLLALNVYQYNAVSDLEAQLYTQGQELATAKSDNNDLSVRLDNIMVVLENDADKLDYILQQAAFAYLSVRVVPNAEGYTYHRLNCPILEGMDRFYVFNSELANALGYSPCVECESLNSSPAQEFQNNITSIRDLVDLIRNGDDKSWYFARSAARAEEWNRNR